MSVSFLLSLGLSAVAILVVRRTAILYDIVDRPVGGRKIHDRPVPLLGGVAIYAAVLVATVWSLLASDDLLGGEISVAHYAGFLLGGFVLMVGGYVDDRYDLPAKYAVLAPMVAAACAVAFGIEVTKLTNPFGGTIGLVPWQSDLLVFAWLMTVMYTTKFLDGLDGLSAGVSSIGAFMIMCLALTAAYFQPDVATLAFICLGAMLGFLAFNFHPATIFLGEGGSTFVGYALGTLAVISGGKLATALLVVAVPMMDVVWIVIRRWRAGGPRNVLKGDRKHLHHRLLDRGWGQRRIVLAYYAVAAAFGGAALFLQSGEKLVALAALAAFMLVVAAVLSGRERNV
jgi:UDP-GlcNAc:undecaprenyl-phosphate GlcNAc-1-phosphate transferase